MSAGQPKQPPLPTSVSEQHSGAAGAGLPSTACLDAVAAALEALPTAFRGHAKTLQPWLQRLSNVREWGETPSTGVTQCLSLLPRVAGEASEVLGIRVWGEAFSSAVTDSSCLRLCCAHDAGAHSPTRSQPVRLQQPAGTRQCLGLVFFRGPRCFGPFLELPTRLR